MKAIQELEREHEAIACMLERFEREIDEAERNFEIDRETIERLLGFFEQEVDGQHQEKEERVFLPCLMRRVTGKDSPHVRKLFREHLEDRRLLAMMRSNMAGACYGEPNCINVLVRYARLYLLRERKHAHWEETVLFSLADRVLTPEDDREILRGFRRIDALAAHSSSRGIPQTAGPALDRGAAGTSLEPGEGSLDVRNSAIYGPVVVPEHPAEPLMALDAPARGRRRGSMSRGSRRSGQSSSGRRRP